jgi:HEAT repeat protein
VIAVCLLINNCAPTKPKLNEQDDFALRELWRTTGNLERRLEVVNELEKRKAADTLIFLINYPVTYLNYANLKYSPLKFEVEDCIAIVQALGRIKDPKAIMPLADAAKSLNLKDVKLAILQAYKEIDHSSAVSPITEMLNDVDPEIRSLSLDVLLHFKDPGSIPAIFQVLYDQDPNNRWKALHILNEIRDPRAIKPISPLLADKDKYVRQLAEIALLNLGVSEEQINDWKQKAKQISLDDLYERQLAYHKAVKDKEALELRLENESDIKLKLQHSLKERETALEKQKTLVESLYENERELKSKLAQLNITQKQSEKYQAELKRLNARVQSLNAELKQAKTQAATQTVREELDKTLEAKSKLEQETKNSQQKESSLREEIAGLNALAEKTRIEAEAAKKEVIALRNREKELTIQVDELKQRLDRSMGPVLVVSKPANGTQIESPNTLLHFIAVDDKGIRHIDVFLNGKPVKIDRQRGLKIVSAEGSFSKKVDIVEKLQLQNGQNIIKITVVDTDGISQEELISVTKVKARGDIWAIVIGINQYRNTRNLKYAVNDARAFKGYLKEYVGIPDERIFYLENQNATRDNIQSLLGTKLKRKASKEDTVIIFYAGHGAVETDPSNPDGDGFEKYLLPYDADLNDLYTTSISMDEIRKIFQRIRADRLIFIADTCYSGASGGRTMMATKARANLSDKFYERGPIFPINSMNGLPEARGA